MIVKITSKEQAEKALREHIGSTGTLVFDLSPELSLTAIPCVIRKCDQHDYEYVGWNIWSKGFEKPAVYCQKCGYVMTSLAEASVVIQGDKVLQLNWRGLKDFYA